MSEFDVIEKVFAPLAGDGAFGLKDDAAVLPPYVLSKDVLVEGVHFLPSDPPDLVARKVLRVNLSDLIAKGCQPQAYLLGCVWRPDTSAERIHQFGEGLAHDQAEFGLKLLGGDTTSGPANVFSLTIIGVPINQQPVLRSGAKPGDKVLVTGTIGDGLLGLEAARQEGSADPEIARSYQLPAIPWGAQGAIARYASAALDVSDGLVADAEHLAQASGVALHLWAERTPLSRFGENAKKAGRLAELMTGGDDYQALLTLPPHQEQKFRAALPAGVTVTVVGEVVASNRAGKVEVHDRDGRPLKFDRQGWDHFKDR